MYPEDLTIDCCSNFLILTRNSDHIYKMKLVLIDPYNTVPEVASIMSSYAFKNTDICSYINRCFIQSYKETIKGLHHNKVYLIVQQCKEIIRVPFLSPQELEVKV